MTTARSPFVPDEKGFPILAARWLAPQVRWLSLAAPLIATHHQPGHFVIVRVRPQGERIPLTIADADPAAGTITVVVQAVGATTEQIAALKVGDHLLDVAGPMGQPTEIKTFGHVCLVGGGVGTAVIHPQAKALKQRNNRVTAVIGGRSRPFVILEEELGAVCDAVYPCTDDGSYGTRGFVTTKLAALLADPAHPIDAVITAGPVLMMKAIAEVTRPAGILTIASLNPVMVDGTGMCGGCRVTVGGKQHFACVDGPEFDAHRIDFDELADRLTAYRAQEAAARKHLEDSHPCQLDERLKG